MTEHLSLASIQAESHPIYRIGRGNDAWLIPSSRPGKPVDRSNIQSGLRFDDPYGEYSVMYVSSQRFACFVETLAPLVRDPVLDSELRYILGEDDFPPSGILPAGWRETRVMGKAIIDGSYAHIYSLAWVNHFRQVLAAECERFGVSYLDAATLQRGNPRRLTQLAARVVYNWGKSERKTLHGIYYRSRYGHDLENWALFLPSSLPANRLSHPIPEDDPDLLDVCRMLGFTG